MDKYTREFFSEEAYYEIQEQHMPFTIIESKFILDTSPKRTILMFLISLFAFSP